MNLKQLEYFVVVAEEKQVTAAAKRLNIAQPPLSYQLKQLEKDLGVQLITRTSHGIELTSAGVILEKYAKQVLDLVNVARHKVQNVNSGTLGILRIGATSTSGGVLPNEKVAKMTASYPDVKFEIREGNTYELLDLLRQNLIDAAIVRTPFNTESLDIRYFNAESMVAVIPEKFANEQLLAKQHLKLEQLQTLPLVVYRRFKTIINDSFEHRGLKPFFAVECDDARTAIRCAESQLGVALIPETCAQRYAHTNVKLIPVAHSAWQTQLALVWKKQKQSAILQRFINAYADDTIDGKEKG